jgi:hypothetical protein
VCAENALFKADELAASLAEATAARAASAAKAAALRDTLRAALDALAADLTVDGDGRVNRRSASRRVLAAATGTLVDRPSRLLLIARGWRRDHVLTREIQAVFDVTGPELRLVRWREQDR